MIEEAYCSEGLYKLLREKGFEGEIHTSYDKDGYTMPVITHQMAMEWLMKTHNYIITVHLDVEEEEATSWVWSIYEVIHPQGGEPYARLYHAHDALFDLEAKNDVIEDALIYAVKFLI